MLPNGGVANFPLLSEEARLRDQENIAEASLARADGDERSECKRDSAQPVNLVFNLNKILWNLITTPSAPQRRLRDILLRSRPPLLGEEGTQVYRFCEASNRWYCG